MLFPVNQLMNWSLLFRACGVIVSTLTVCVAAELRTTIMDRKGTPIPQARVIVHSLNAAESLTPIKSFGGESDKNGLVTMDGLTEGAWAACVFVPGEAYLNPCEWDQANSVVTIGKSAVTERAISLETGVRVHIRVEDPWSVLRKDLAGAGIGGNTLSIGLRKPDGHLLPASRVSSDKDGHNYEIVIPADAVFGLETSGHNVAVFDDAERRVSNGWRRDLRVSRNEKAVVKYRIALSEN